jgi:P27 family predicted phage terminase small subunit
VPRARKLRVVELREGKPGHRPAPEGLWLQPLAPAEPDWRDIFPSGGARTSTNARARRVASAFWRYVVSVLEPQGIVAELDFAALQRAATLWARIDEAERILSHDGLTKSSERGHVRHPVATILNQMNERLLSVMRDFGMTPAARDRLNPRLAGGTPDDDFDV